MKLVKNIYEFESADSLEVCLIKEDYILNNYVYEKFKKCIESGDSDILLFRINDKHIGQQLNIKVDRDFLIPPLEKCIQKFEKIEEYEKCKDVLKLINILENEMYM